ncbi:hypothetical protein [Maridesulfovibrio sp.]|uniref:hypothetical protein n=1 Tax=Maridesulfovibrio sp. TaxID=2795000 RepID=UPI0029CA242B|nr:hypothetical protein [Maridesulfovibrio sp.]
MIKSDQDRKWEITAAISEITRFFYVRNNPDSFKDPAVLVCGEVTGSWELVEMDSLRARRSGTAVGPHVVRVDRAKLKVTSGGINELLDMAELERELRMQGKVVEGVRRRHGLSEGMCMVECEENMWIGEACRLRARPGHLTCALHADYEEVAQALLLASMKPPRVKA